MYQIKVTIESLSDEGRSVAAQECNVQAGSTIGELIPAVAANGLPVLAALANNDVVPLFFPLAVRTVLRPLTLDDENGWRVYRWSLCFILAKAVHETFPGLRVRVRHSFGNGLFCSVEWKDGLDRSGTIEKIEAKMREIVAADIPIKYMLQSYEEAIERFTANKQYDKLFLLQHRNPPSVVLADCGGYLYLLQEPLVCRTGLLTTFALTPYEDGFILRLPFKTSPHHLAPLASHKHLFDVYQEHIRQGRILGVTTAGELNQVVIKREADEFIRVAEALHEQKFAELAEQIATRPAQPRLILIAGPSSAGKTTSAKRLIPHLRVHGLRPFVISTDDYFVGDERNPRDENGMPDYENINAVDLERLNHDLSELLSGHEVTMPYFDFKQHRPFDREGKFHIDDGQVIVMEGIHSLNPDLTPQIPTDVKFRIYVSALTQLGIDNSCRVSTTDNRLIRRMVRDMQFRGRGAVDTLRMWPSVRKGEARWIFPFQHFADATFNSALDYELGVLKNYAIPALNTVKPGMVEYAEARRLSAMLQNFMVIPDTAVPGVSILREYIGGSQLRY